MNLAVVPVENAKNLLSLRAEGSLMRMGTLQSHVSRNNMCLLLHRLPAAGTKFPQLICSRGLNLCLSIWQTRRTKFQKYQIQTNIAACSWAQMLKKIPRAFSRIPSIVLVKVWFQKAFIPLIGNEDNFRSFSLWYHCFRQTCSRILPYYCYSHHRKCRWVSMTWVNAKSITNCAPSCTSIH